MSRWSRERLKARRVYQAVDRSMVPGSLVRSRVDDGHGVGVVRKVEEVWGSELHLYGCPYVHDRANWEVVVRVGAPDNGYRGDDPEEVCPRCTYAVGVVKGSGYPVVYCPGCGYLLVEAVDRLLWGNGRASLV